MVARGGFKLTKWISNSDEVMNSIPEEDRAPSVKNFQERETLVERALGVKYDVKTDMLVFEVAKLSSKVGEKGEKMTKRKTHSFVHSFYDPIGILSPITLILKKLTQKYAKYAWDHPIPEEEVQPFYDWVEKMPEIDKLSVRC